MVSATKEINRVMWKEAFTALNQGWLVVEDKVRKPGGWGSLGEEVETKGRQTGMRSHRSNGKHGLHSALWYHWKDSKVKILKPLKGFKGKGAIERNTMWSKKGRKTVSWERLHWTKRQSPGPWASCVLRASGHTRLSLQRPLAALLQPALAHSSGLSSSVTPSELPAGSGLEQGSPSSILRNLHNDRCVMTTLLPWIFLLFHWSRNSMKAGAWRVSAWHTDISNVKRTQRQCSA